MVVAILVEVTLVAATSRHPTTSTGSSFFYRPMALWASIIRLARKQFPRRRSVPLTLTELVRMGLDVFPAHAVNCTAD